MFNDVITTPTYKNDNFQDIDYYDNGELVPFSVMTVVT